MDEETRWWGRFPVEEGRVGRWRIGSLTLYVQRLPSEWRLAHVSENDPLATAVEVTPDAGLDALPADLGAVRHGMARPGGHVVLAPALADRPVVSRPEHHFEVPAGHEATLLVSTPLWVRVVAGDPEAALADVPALRPSDTWFGPSTRTGELCYSGRTCFRTRLENVPVRPHRATTALRVRNRGSTALVLERVLLPVLHLSLFCDGHRRLWTQSVRLDHEADEAEPLRLEPGPPEEAGACEPVAEPRSPVTDNRVVRAFSFIFGG